MIPTGHRQPVNSEVYSDVEEGKSEKLANFMALKKPSGAEGTTNTSH